MELRQLEYLVAVAEEGSFTRAADRVHITQSGISAQIRELERDLGARLIDRSTRRVVLTAAGAAALQHARSTLSSASAVRQAVDDVTGVVRGRVVVGMVSGCAITPLFEALSTFHRAHPGIEIALVEDESDRLVDAVRAGAVDLALIGTADSPPPGLQALTILSEPVVAAVPVGHPLAAGRPIRLADLSSLPLICLPRGTGIRTVFDRACTTAGVRVDIALQASAPAAVADLAERGLGVAILSESMTSTNRLHAVHVAELRAPAFLALTWAATDNRALRALLDHGRRAFGAGRGVEVDRSTAVVAAPVVDEWVR